MTNENDVMNQAPNPQQQQGGQQPTFSYGDVESNFRTRLKKQNEKHQKEKDELTNRLEQLEKKVYSGNASSSEKLDYQQGLSAADQAHKQVNSGEISPQEFESALQAKYLEMEASRKMKEAMEKDPEFDQLMKKNSALPAEQQAINKGEAEVIIASGISNVPAVIKHLLKNKRDSQTYKLMLAHYARDGGRSLNEFLYDISENLEMSASRPRPNEFKIIPKVNDMGTGDDFSEGSYISEKYT